MFLSKFKHYFSSRRVILASSSPRRKSILENVGLSVEVIPSDFPEDLDPADFPSLAEFTIETAIRKAQAVLSGGASADLVIGADTIVVLEGDVYGKPGTPASAQEMLRKFSGKTHEVLTGVALIWGGGGVTETFSEITRVTMGSLAERTIEDYVRTGEPLDKAGGYGIQGLGGCLVERIEGDYYNVVGFPLHRFCTRVSGHLASSTTP